MKDRRKAIRFIVNERGCHICTSHYLDKNGYPLRFENGKQMRLHRAMFLMNNPLPDIENFVVRHICDTPSCINPEHLIAGTVKDNTRDALERNRRNYGELNGSAKLKAELINEIRNSQEGCTKLSRKFNISRVHVWRIKNNRTWEKQ